LFLSGEPYTLFQRLLAPRTAISRSLLIAKGTFEPDVRVEIVFFRLVGYIVQGGVVLNYIKVTFHLVT
jgi:hypothetical protein